MRGKGLSKYFKTPLKGVLDIVLIMSVTIFAVLFLGPIILENTSEVPVERQSMQVFDYMCAETGRIIKDILIDENGTEYGWVDILYYDNGNFKEVIEINERERIIRNVHYSEEGDFMYWYEIYYDSDGSEVLVKKFDRYGNGMELAPRFPNQ